MFNNLENIYDRDLSNCRVTAEPARFEKAYRELPSSLPDIGLGEEATKDVVLNTIAPALAAGQAGPRYFGFVTGGRTPISLLSDFVASSYDANVQVHLPNDTIATHVEALALSLVLDLLSLPRTRFPGRTVTTGATSSNLLGLALGRQYAISQIKGARYSVAEEGFGGVEVDILCAGAHASIRKAAALVGIGRARVKDLTDEAKQEEPVAFDLPRLEQELKHAKEKGRGMIVCPAYGEVNTGAFTPDMQEIRRLCDKYGAWMHLDAAFGGFGCLHPDFPELQAGMQLADSLTLDGHKWLNVPYDCGLFFTRDSVLHQAVCGPGGLTPAYLNAAASDIPSPLNVGIENSRRFRALPLYSNLLCYGQDGYRQIICRNIEFARKVEAWLYESPYYDVLTPPSTSSSATGHYRVLNIVLFAPSAKCGIAEFEDEVEAGARMVTRINESGKMYVTGTKWKGRTAARLAVSNWQTGLDASDLEIVQQTLLSIMNIT